MNLRPHFLERAPLPDPLFSPAETALLVVDMQYLDAHPDYGLVAAVKAQGRLREYEYFTRRLSTIVPNIQRLLNAFRKRRSEVIYSAIESLTRDGRDRSHEYKRLGIVSPPGSKEAGILAELAPQDDEIVLKKTCTGVFNGTNLHYVLRNLGVRTLVLCGVTTTGCVESAAREASDLGYEGVVVEDASGSWTQEMHDAAILTIKDLYVKIYSTEELISRLAAAAPAAIFL